MPEVDVKAVTDRVPVPQAELQLFSRPCRVCEAKHFCMNAKFLVSMCVIGVIAFFVVPVQSQAPAPNSVSGARTAEQATNPQAPGGGHGLVWVNTEAGVYHREGSPLYGTTRKGKYMTEQDAIQAGYKRAPKAPFL
jgi:hypothetical protein